MKTPRVVQNISLVLGSLAFAVLVIEGASRHFLTARKITEEPLRIPGEFQDFQDIQDHLSASGRIGEIARIIATYEKFRELNWHSPEEQDLRDEWPSFSKSSQGHELWVAPDVITPGLNDDFTVTGKRSGRTKYRAHYTTDEGSRRLAYQGGGKDPRNIVFLGCSFTFGQGINDADTFPYLVGKKLGIRTTNLGFPGAGPSHILWKLRNNQVPFAGMRADKETTYVLTVIPEHIPRVIGTVSHFRQNENAFFDSPYMFLDGETLVSRESFSLDRTGGKHFLWLLSKFHFPTVLGFDLPRLNTDQYRLFARVIVEIENELRRKNPRMKEFVVSFFPSGHARTIFRELKDAFVAEKIKVFDYTFVSGSLLLGSAYYLRYDGHPTPLANEFYSDLLVNDLRSAPLTAGGSI